jgi:hypothetical protein
MPAIPDPTIATSAVKRSVSRGARGGANSIQSDFERSPPVFMDCA